LFNSYMGPDDVMGDKLTLHQMEPPEFNALRAVFLDPKIAPASASLAVAVQVDGLIIGAFAFNYGGPSHSNWDTHIIGPQIYMLTDFAIDGPKYNKLSKLILYAVLSKETLDIVQHASKQRVRSVVTTAFSDRPQSMKYRGLFDLVSRQVVEQEHPYMLNYGAIAGQWTLAEGLAQWKEKYGSDIGGAKDE